MRDLENSKPGGLDPSWAVAPQKGKNDDFTGLLKTIDLEIFGYKFTGLLDKYYFEHLDLKLEVALLSEKKKGKAVPLPA